MRNDDDDIEGDEAISALIDGELDPADAGRVLDRVEREPGLRERWARYHALRSTLEGSPAGRVSGSFAARVGEALADEPAVLAPRSLPRPAPRWVRPVAGFAIAASVALVAVGALFALQRPGGGIATGPVASADRDDRRLAGTVPPPGEAGATPAALTAQGDIVASESARRRMGIYLTSHSEFAGAADLPGVVPYTRLTGFNAGQ